MGGHKLPRVRCVTAAEEILAVCRLAPEFAGYVGYVSCTYGYLSGPESALFTGWREDLRPSFTDGGSC